jgi:ADP-heptose:LPS heptosyltransferase
VNLQYGKNKEQIEPFEKETGRRVDQTHVNTFFDLEGIAATMQCCDVVVSCSNANVHIAGGMGKPVLMFDANKLWYWNGKDGDRSLWYPSLRMFNRKNMVAPWDDQVRDITKALKEMRNGKLR